MTIVTESIVIFYVNGLTETRFYYADTCPATGMEAITAFARRVTSECNHLNKGVFFVSVSASDTQRNRYQLSFQTDEGHARYVAEKQSRDYESEHGITE